VANDYPKNQAESASRGTAIPLVEAWEIYASTMPASLADAIEENAIELGLEDGTDDFYRECLLQYAAEIDSHPTIPTLVEELRVGDQVVGTIRVMAVVEVLTMDGWNVVRVVLAHPEDASITTTRDFRIGSTVEVVR
jgi:hypothetical protein